MPRGEERLERAVEQGAGSRARSDGYRRWPTGRRRGAPIRQLLSEWQVYRLLDVPRGAWTAFQYLVRERLREDGVDVLADGTLEPEAGGRASAARRSRHETASRGARTGGRAPSSR